jgi:hypothetical protein
MPSISTIDGDSKTGTGLAKGGAARVDRLSSDLHPWRGARLAAVLLGAASVSLFNCSLLVKTDDLSGGPDDAGAPADDGSTGPDAPSPVDARGGEAAEGDEASSSEGAMSMESGSLDDVATRVDSDSASADSGEHDARSEEGAIESGTSDSSSPDSGTTDATVDAGASDAGVDDAPPPDAGGADSPAVDSGPPTPLSRAGWVATAFMSLGTNPPSYVLDGSGTTRWTAGVSQAATQWFEVDMTATHTFREIALDAGTQWTADYMRGYQVFVSSDGSTWGSPIATGVGASQVVTIDFAPVSARYIRVVLTAASPTTKWWSVAEWNVLD